MSVFSIASGAETADGTQETLATETDPGVYVLVVDTANLINGEAMTIRIKTKDKSGGTSRLAYQATYAHAQTEPHKYSIPIPVDTEIVCTLEQTAYVTAYKVFDWNLLKM